MDDQTAQAVARIRAALAASAEAYVRVTAADLHAICRAAGRADLLAARAAEMVAGGRPDTAIGCHRDAHLAPLLAAVPA